jgi:hypothetical protein
VRMVRCESSSTLTEQASRETRPLHVFVLQIFSGHAQCEEIGALHACCGVCFVRWGLGCAADIQACSTAFCCILLSKAPSTWHAQHCGTVCMGQVGELATTTLAREANRAMS